MNSESYAFCSIGWAVRAPKGVNHADWSTSMKFGMSADLNVVNSFFEGAKAIRDL